MKTCHELLLVGRYGIFTNLCSLKSLVTELDNCFLVNKFSTDPPDKACLQSSPRCEMVLCVGDTYVSS